MSHLRQRGVGRQVTVGGRRLGLGLQQLEHRIFERLQLGGCKTEGISILTVFDRYTGNGMSVVIQS